MLAIQGMDHGINMFSLLNQQKLDYCYFMFYTLFLAIEYRKMGPEKEKNKKNKNSHKYLLVCPIRSKLHFFLIYNSSFNSLKSSYDHCERILKESEKKFKGATHLVLMHSRLQGYARFILIQSHWAFDPWPATSVPFSTSTIHPF